MGRLREYTPALAQGYTVDGNDVAKFSDGDTVSGIPVVYSITVPDGATGNVDTVIADKIRVTDVVVVKTGGAGGASDTLAVSNGAAAITDAISLNVADTVIVRPATIDDAQHAVAAGGTLRVTRTKASAANVACIVYVHAIKV